MNAGLLPEFKLLLCRTQVLRLTMFAVTCLMASPPPSLCCAQNSVWYLLLRVNSLPSQPSVTWLPRPASFTFLAVSRPGYMQRLCMRRTFKLQRNSERQVLHAQA